MKKEMNTTKNELNRKDDGNALKPPPQREGVQTHHFGDSVSRRVLLSSGSRFGYSFETHPLFRLAPAVPAHALAGSVGTLRLYMKPAIARAS